MSWLHSSPETPSSCSTKRICSRRPLWHQQRSQALSHSTAGQSASLRMRARMSSWQDLPQLYKRGKPHPLVQLDVVVLMRTCRYHLQDVASEEARAPLITHARHRSHLESALGFLDAFLETSGALRFLNPIQPCLMSYPTHAHSRF